MVFIQHWPRRFCSAAIWDGAGKGETMKGRTKAVILSTMIVTVAGDAQARTQRHCAPRDAVVERLAEGYGETRQSVGLGRDNSMVEVFASRKSGSWTITVTSPAGLTCLIASGQSFEPLDETLPNFDEDA